MYRFVFSGDDEERKKEIRFEITEGVYEGAIFSIKDLDVADDFSTISYLYALEKIPNNPPSLVDEDNIPESLKSLVDEIFSKIIHDAIKHHTDNYERTNEEIGQRTINPQGNSSE